MNVYKVFLALIHCNCCMFVCLLVFFCLFVCWVHFVVHGLMSSLFREAFLHPSAVLGCYFRVASLLA